jgi:thiamine biosynthesis protein ThiS
VTTQSISLTLNGKPRDLPGETALLDLLQQLGVDRRTIAVAHNGDVIPRDTYESVVLRDGDSLEVVRMVGGG